MNRKKLSYGYELVRERPKWYRGKRWNAYHLGRSLGWSYRYYQDAAEHMETVLRFEAVAKQYNVDGTER